MSSVFRPSPSLETLETLTFFLNILYIRMYAAEQSISYCYIKCDIGNM